MGDNENSVTSLATELRRREGGREGETGRERHSIEQTNTRVSWEEDRRGRERGRDTLLLHAHPVPSCSCPASDLEMFHQNTIGNQKPVTKCALLCRVVSGLVYFRNLSTFAAQSGSDEGIA